METRNEPLISVVIPTRNEGGYIGRLLESIDNQTYKNYEVIVCDHNSLDSTLNIARNYNTKIVKVKRRGIAIGKNAGLKTAKGEIIAFIDADYVLSKNLFKRIVDSFKKDEGVVLLQPLHAIDSKSARNSLKIRVLNRLENVNLRIGSFFGVSVFGCVFCKRSVVDKIGGFNEDLDVMEDLHFYLKFRDYGKIKSIKDRVKVSYRRYMAGGALKTVWFYFKAYFAVLVLAHEEYHAQFEPVR